MGWPRPPPSHPAPWPSLSLGKMLAHGVELDIILTSSPTLFSTMTCPSSRGLNGSTGNDNNSFPSFPASITLLVFGPQYQASHCSKIVFTATSLSPSSKRSPCSRLLIHGDWTFREDWPLSQYGPSYDHSPSSPTKDGSTIHGPWTLRQFLVHSWQEDMIHPHQDSHLS